MASWDLQWRAETLQGELGVYVPREQRYLKDRLNVTWFVVARPEIASQDAARICRAYNSDMSNKQLDMFHENDDNFHQRARDEMRSAAMER